MSTKKQIKGREARKKGKEWKKETNAHLKLPVGVLEARGVTLPQVSLSLDTDLNKVLRDTVRLVVKLLTLLVRRLCGNTGRNNDDLELSNTGRENETLVVSVDHNHHTNRPRRETPRVLPDLELVSSRVRRVLNGDTEHLGEVLTKAVGGSSLDTATSGRDETLDGGGVETSGELLLLRLDTGNDGNGEELLVNAAVEVEDLENLLVGFGLGEEGGVALLPEELTSTEEGLCERQICQYKRGEREAGGSVRGFLNSHRTTEFHWLSLRGRSR
jgi:hypothetical protein